MTGSSLNSMSWRFLPASDSAVQRFCVRDIDSRLSIREKAAVDDWMKLGEKFHVMRDHPSHSKYAMSGGMWCGTQDAVPDMNKRLENRSMSEAARHEFFERFHLAHRQGHSGAARFVFMPQVWWRQTFSHATPGSGACRQR